MKVRYMFTVYADTPVAEEYKNAEDLSFCGEVSPKDAVKHMKRLLQTKCDFSDVDIELISVEVVED